MRTDNIKKNLTMRQIIDHFSISCQTDGAVTQIHCPFHANDAHASARIYDTGTMYCFFCSKVWDVISFVKDHKSLEFNKACLYLEEVFGIKRPDVEEVYKEQETLTQFLDKAKSEKTKVLDFDTSFSKISDRLVHNRNVFSLNEYSRYFNFLDNLYSSYKMNDYEDDNFLKNTLDCLHKEISKRI